MNYYEEKQKHLRQELIEPLSEHIVFDDGLRVSELNEIESVYQIRFPMSLREFFACAYPVRLRNTDITDGFPDWRNLSRENVESIRARMEAPVLHLVRELKRDHSLCDCWRGLTPDEVGECAPQLIPLFSHRYLPCYGYNPPVFSAVGRDVIGIGENLHQWYRWEFLREAPNTTDQGSYVPVWSDIHLQHQANADQLFGKKNPFFSADEFTELFRKNPSLLNEFGFRFRDDPISPKQPGFIEERMIGWHSDGGFWMGGCDDPRGQQWDTVDELINAPMFCGQSLRERWDDIVWLTFMGIDPAEWIRCCWKNH